MYSAGNAHSSWRGHFPIQKVRSLIPVGLLGTSDGLVTSFKTTFEVIQVYPSEFIVWEF